jgi:hypothetical protein
LWENPLRKLLLFFHSNSGYFKSNNQIATFLLENCKELRQQCHWRRRNVEFAIDGDATPEQTDIVRATGLMVDVPHVCRQVKAAIEEADSLFPHRNVCSSQPCAHVSSAALCSGSAQARLIFGSGLLRFAHPYYAAQLRLTSLEIINF